MTENHNSGVDELMSELERKRPQKFSSWELKSFTSNLQIKLGSGAFGVVYKGEFPDRRQVAVKVLKNNTIDVMDEQFISEVGTMGRTFHDNLIKLYGFCFDADMKALVYEYMEKGSLESILYDPHIKWVDLYKIAIKIARGLSFLHCCSPQIIHHDIKPANVLLDSKLCPKITDFGLARLNNKGLSHFTQTAYRGTPGYAAPEVCMNYPSITCKCDVYSFGIMLFDILGRKKYSEGEEWFPPQVWKHFQNGQLDKIIMECGIGEEDKEDAEILSKVALLCAQFNAQDRPSMSTVVTMLKKEIPLGTPKDNPFPLYVSSSDSRTKRARHESARMVSPAYDERSSSSEAREPKLKQGAFLNTPIVHDQRNMNQIQDSERTIIDRLVTTRDVVKRLIDAALNNNQVIREPVQIWLQRVEVVQEEAKHLGRKADKNIIQALLDEGDTFGDIVSDPKPIQSLEILSSGDFDAFASRESTTKKIVEALEDGKIGLIGVFGMPGVGKTMLLEAIFNKVKKERIFDKVVMVIVSQNPDLEKIQDNIANGLDLRFHDGDTSFTKKEKLNDIINQGKKTLVVLDDVWERLEIAKVGIPHKDVNKDCKVVFTTRFRDVCGRMESDVSIEVTTLTEEDSWQLFRKRVGDASHNSILPRVVKDIANECKGLPLAIATLGRALRGKDETVWNNALLLLKKSNYDGMSPVFSSIKMSYDFLSSEEKKMCFLFCCLYPEDCKIDTNIIFFHVMGEKLFRNADTFLVARSIFHLIVDELVSSCLLIRDEEMHVMLHDVVRDVALSIASAESNRFIVKAGMNLTEWPDVELDNCNRLSLMSNKITCFPPYQIKAPNLLTLCLNENSGIEEIPSDFFEGMQNLTTLDMSKTMVKSLPPSFSCLRSLRVLCMANCRNLVDISPIERLDKLEILSFHGYEKIQSWESLRKLTTIKMLDLSNYFRSGLLPPWEVISNLHRLEELHIIGYLTYLRYQIDDDVDQIDDNDDGDQRDEDGDESDDDVDQIDDNDDVDEIDDDVDQIDDNDDGDQRDEDGDESDDDCNQSDFRTYTGKKNRSDFIGFSEVACLTRLTCLHMNLSTHECNSQEILPSHWENLTEFIFVCRSRDLNSFEYEFPIESRNLKKRMFLELPSISVPNWIQVLSGWTNSLHLRSCLHLKSVDQLNPCDMFDNLKLLDISQCKSMTHLYSTALYCEAKAPMYAFRNLETLKLERLPELVAFCDGTLPQGFFQNLKFLEVDYCDKVIILIPCDLLERMQNLEKLEVECCDDMEKVVQLTSNATQSMSSSGPSFPIFPKLRELRIFYCSKLKYLLPMRVLRELRQLEILKIYGSYMVMIVEHENYKEDEVVDVDQDKAILPRLKSLDLFELPELMSFCTPRLFFDWPALEYLRVYDCWSLKRLPLHTNSAPKLRTLDVEQLWFDWLEWDDKSLKSRLQPFVTEDNYW